MSHELAIYVHWPFCQSKCPYCDFNSYVAESIDHVLWRHALLTELEALAGETPGRTVTSVFFGGGTPSLMPPKTAADVIDAIGRKWRTADDLEITLEGNPSTTEIGLFGEFRAAGVNRLSVGVQSFDDASLWFLGRRHSAAEARNAIVAAQRHFPRTSFDMIYGLPAQTTEGWRRELTEALELAGEHLSLYQLTIEPGTPFHRDCVEAADDDTGSELYELTHELTGAAGLPAYEVSNHAYLGAECRHNLNIWRGGDYAGVGPSAHGRLTTDGVTHAVYRIHDAGRWLEAVAERGHGTAKRTLLAPEGRCQELVMTGLRLAEGIDRGRFRRLAVCELLNAVDSGGLERMIDGGFVALDDDRLTATPAGRLRLNAVLGELLT
ncbi:MAG: radical SAM family heme chaperone HemW [Pseudomonadota bacterium]|nr:radical SAM family heme chaperone HemW [Pseudomonadota bacterium]